jgi:uncharacterized protein (DUF2164 family)
LAIKLGKDTEKKLIASIQRYVAENLDEEIGDLKATLFLDYCLQEIAPSVYNQAIMDAQTHMNDRVADLEGLCHETEFGFWEKDPGSTR